MSQIRIYRSVLQGWLSISNPVKYIGRQTKESNRTGVLMQFYRVTCGKRKFSSIGNEDKKPRVRGTEVVLPTDKPIQENYQALQQETAIEEKKFELLYRYFKKGYAPTSWKEFYSLLENKSSFEEVCKYKNTFNRTCPERLFWKYFFHGLNKRIIIEENFAEGEFAHALQWLSELMEYMETREGNEVVWIYSMIASFIGKYYVMRKIVCPPHHQDIIRECHRRIRNISDTMCGPILNNLITGYFVTDDISIFCELVSKYFLTDVSWKILLVNITYLLRYGSVYRECIHGILAILGDTHLILDSGAKNTGQLPNILDKNIVQAYLQACDDSSSLNLDLGFDSSTSTLAVGSLFSFMRQHHLVPCEVMVKYIKEHFERKMKGNWKGTVGRILTHEHKKTFPSSRISGTVCSNCLKLLPVDEVTNEEVKLLREYIQENLLLGNDIFRNCRPEELGEIIDTVKTAGPFDLVVDAANTFMPFNDLPSDAEKMMDLINHKFPGRKLFIVRSHMLRRFRRLFSGENVVVLPVRNVTSDDLCYIYAALLSGPDTKLISNDYYKNHFHVLKENKTKALFAKWQNSRQILFKMPGRDWVPSLYMPAGTDKHTTMSGNNLHVPFYGESSSRVLFFNPTHVLCLTKRPGRRHSM